MKSVLIVGGKGRMGSLSAAAVAAQDDLDLVALVDPLFSPTDQALAATFSSVDAALQAVQPTVAVEFSTPATVYDNVCRLLTAGVHTIVGATGLTDGQIAELAAISVKSAGNLLVVPNFSIGAVLLMRFAQEASRYFGSAEIIELHHDRKVDAPSGTALRTAALMGQSPECVLHAPRDAQVAARGMWSGHVPIHSVRLPGLIAHQEVLFGGDGEVLTLRHDSLSRESFMPGVLLSIRRVTGLKEPAVGLENILP